jgi:hypothetical protein
LLQLDVFVGHTQLAGTVCLNMSKVCWAVCCGVLGCGVQEAGLDESAQLMVEDVMMSKNVPDPRDVRKYDLIGVFGMVNYRTLRVSPEK